MHLAGKDYGGWGKNIGFTQQRHYGDIGFLDRDLGPEDHLGQKVLGGLELRGGQIEVEVLTLAGDIHVVQNVALDI